MKVFQKSLSGMEAQTNKMRITDFWLQRHETWWMFISELFFKLEIVWGYVIHK